MLASEARLVLEAVASDLSFAGMAVDLGGPDGAEYWPHFVAVVRDLLARLRYSSPDG